MVIFKLHTWDLEDGDLRLISSKVGHQPKYNKEQEAYTITGGDQTIKLLRWTPTITKCINKF